MISRFHSLAVLLLAASLAACSSTGSTPTDQGSASMPQQANSLPPGDAVNAPMAQPTGEVGRTRVSRTRYASSRRARMMRHSVRHSRRMVHHRRAHHTVRRATPASTTAQ